MKTKLITGLVALGIGQITAQQTKPTPAATPPVFVTDKTKPQLHGDAHVIHINTDYRLPGASTVNTATLATAALVQPVGNVPVYACVQGETPPNCRAIASPPVGIGPCDAWPLVALFTSEDTVQCPLNFVQNPVGFVYYMPTCSGNPPFAEVGRWTLSRDAGNVTGTCKTGYQATTNITVISPDCQTGQGCTSQTLVDQDLSYSASTNFDDCGALYHSWTFGPFPKQTTVHVNGYVDDDVRINGEILSPFCCLFNSGRGVQCDGLVNGAHDFDTTFTLPAGMPVEIDVINNFASGVSLQGHIKVTSQ